MSVGNQRAYYTELGSHSGLSYTYFGCLEQRFPEGIFEPYEGTILHDRLAKSAASNVFPYFVSFRAHG